MIKLDRILAVVRNDDSATPVLAKARDIAVTSGAQVFVAQVIFDTNVETSRHDTATQQEIKMLMMEAAEEWLDDEVARADLPGNHDSVTLWHKDPFEAILDAAVDCGAQLILKASAQPEGFEAVLHAPQDWHLLRHAEVPVMLVKPAAWVKEPVILAAIDALHENQAALNQRILEEAAGLTQILGGSLDIVVAHPFVQPMIGPNTVPVDFDRIRKEAEAEIKETVEHLAASQGVNYRYLHIEEGTTAHAVGRAADQCNAEILVMGTVARTGIRGLLLGNTSETILYRVNCDVAVLR